MSYVEISFFFSFLQCEKLTKKEPSQGKPDECKPQGKRYSLRSQKDQPFAPVNDFTGCTELALVISPVVTESSTPLPEKLPNCGGETSVFCQRKRKLVYQEEDHSVEPKSGDTTFNEIGGCYNGESIADEMPLHDPPLAITLPGFFISSYLCTS